MLVRLKHYILDNNPTKEDLETAKQICIEDSCVVELQWCPSVYAGWYKIFVQPNSDIDEIYNEQIPRIYPV